MADNENGRGGLGSLRQQAEKVASLSPEDFQKLPLQDVRNLIGDLLLVARDLERQVQRLRQTRAELEESRKKATELFNFAPVGYLILDNRGVITDVNVITRHLLSVPRDSLINAPFADFVEPQYRDAFASYLKEIARIGSLLSIELEMHKGDGSLFWAQLQTVTLYEGSNLIFRVAVADVTGRKNAEESLRASEKRYRSFIEVTGILGWMTDAAGDVTEDIPSWRQFTGQTYEEVKGRGWSKALHPDDLERTLQSWQKAVSEKSRYDNECRLRRHDGVYRYFLARGVPVFADDGRPVEWVGTSIDITERKQADEALRESEQRFRDLADLFPEIVFEADATGGVTYVNKKAIASLYLNADDQSQGFNIFGIITPEQRGTASERFRRILSEGDIGADEYTLLRRDGTAFPALVHSARIMRGGQIWGIRGVAVDITGHKPQH